MASLGLGSSSWGMVGRAGLGGFVEALAELGLGCGLLTQAGARAPGVGASGGEGEVAPPQSAGGARAEGLGDGA